MRELTEGGRRLLETAAGAFYAEGIHAVGVDTVTARAGVSKPTLYAQFGSKDNLVAEVLARRAQARQDALGEHLSGTAGAARALAVFDWVGQSYQAEGARGCAFLNAAAELPDPRHPARAVAAAYKEWLRALFADAARQEGLPGPAADALGEALLMLLDGASARVTMTADASAVGRAKAAAARLLAVGLDG